MSRDLKTGTVVRTQKLILSSIDKNPPKNDKWLCVSRGAIHVHVKLSVYLLLLKYWNDDIQEKKTRNYDLHTILND